MTSERPRRELGFWMCTALVVGDVAGHGITAAARMTEAKATIRTLVLNVDHAEVIPAANRSLAHFDSGYIATAAVAWLDDDAKNRGVRIVREMKEEEQTLKIKEEVENQAKRKSFSG